MAKGSSTARDSGTGRYIDVGSRPGRNVTIIRGSHGETVVKVDRSAAAAALRRAAKHLAAAPESLRLAPNG